MYYTKDRLHICNLALPSVLWNSQALVKVAPDTNYPLCNKMCCLRTIHTPKKKPQLPSGCFSQACNSQVRDLLCFSRQGDRAAHGDQPTPCTISAWIEYNPEINYGSVFRQTSSKKKSARDGGSGYHLTVLSRKSAHGRCILLSQDHQTGEGPGGRSFECFHIQP